MTEQNVEADPLADETDVPPTEPYDEGKETDIPPSGEPDTEDHPAEAGLVGEVPF